MDRIIDAIEWCAATFVGIVALNIFLAVVLRKFFSWQIPVSYDVGKMLLGTLIFWGIAATSYRAGHRQAVHGGHPARLAGDGDVCADDRAHRQAAAALPACRRGQAMA
jgi:hypothetical protein